MNILITGAAGFTGKRLSRRLAESGHMVYALARNLEKCRINSFLSHPNITVVECNLRKLNLKNLPSNIDVVYSLAQSQLFREFPAKAEDIFDVNIQALFEISQWARDKASKFIHVSSGGIYGGSSSRILTSKMSSAFAGNSLKS